MFENNKSFSLHYQVISKKSAEGKIRIVWNASAYSNGTGRKNVIDQFCFYQ